MYFDARAQSMLFFCTWHGCYKDLPYVGVRKVRHWGYVATFANRYEDVND